VLKSKVSPAQSNLHVNIPGAETEFLSVQKIKIGEKATTIETPSKNISSEKKPRDSNIQSDNLNNEQSIEETKYNRSESLRPENNTPLVTQTPKLQSA